MHKHDDNNPFGLHRHYVDEDVDGAHVHSPQNPGGEHAHGELKGVALIDGKHHHDGNGLGWHHHCDHEENYGEIPVEKPGQVLPEPKQSTPPREDS